MALSDEQQENIKNELKSILPTVFPESEEARDFLVAIGRRPGDINQQWRSAESFWIRELELLAQGVIIDGISQAVREAARRFPGNHRLQGLLGMVDRPDENGDEDDDGPAPPARDTHQKPPLQPTRIIKDHGPRTHALTLINSDRSEDFLQLVRDVVDSGAQPCYAAASQSAVEIPDPGDRGGEIEQQVLAAVRDWGADIDVAYESFPFRPELLDRIVVHGPDGAAFEVLNVPNTTQVADIARAVVHQYADAPSPRGRSVRTTIDLIQGDGPAARLNPADTLGAAGVRNGAELRQAPQATLGSTLGGVTPGLWREAVWRASAQIRSYAGEHPGFVIVKTDDEELPTEYTAEFSADGFGSPPDPEEWPLRPHPRDEHRVHISLPAEFPVVPPIAVWQTDIFHPNVLAAPQGVAPKGFVCLGPLMDAYQPDMDFGLLCQMLVDLAGYRLYEAREPEEYDGEGYLNRPAARWARSDAGQQAILKRGGTPITMEQVEEADEASSRRKPQLDIRPLDDWAGWLDEG